MRKNINKTDDPKNNDKYNPCIKCKTQAECALNNWCLFDRDNKECPNRQERLKQEKWFQEQK